MTEIAKINTFSIFYDAEDSEFNEHKMNAYELGSSIMGISKMIAHADKLLNNEQSIELLVSAPAREGSFAVDFAVTIVNSGAIDVLKFLGFTAASSAISSGAALTIARRLNRKRIINVITEPNTENAIIEVDGDIVECDRTVALLVTNPDVRQAMNEVITQPLTGKSTPVFRVEVDGVETVRLKNEEVIEFTPLPRNSLRTEDTKTIVTNITFIQVNFESSSGWKMVFEGKERSVKMEDAAFMQRVRDNAKSFTKGDMFEVELDIVSSATAKSERTSYVITNVIRHRASSDRKLL